MKRKHINGKVVHKLTSRIITVYLESNAYSEEARTLCKIHYKTWAFNYSNLWKKVTCKRCLEARK